MWAQFQCPCRGISRQFSGLDNRIPKVLSLACRSLHRIASLQHRVQTMEHKLQRKRSRNFTFSKIGMNFSLETDDFLFSSKNKRGNKQMNEFECKNTEMHNTYYMSHFTLFTPTPYVISHVILYYVAA